ncbi:hypothetical protein WKW79_35805 [Variovorax robiniae]|uniref:Uncharacterized protein n=1 Tax=Variovorax robiniae TaxID=1836199 RepID=A0ABU8XJA9_9BURK
MNPQTQAGRAPPVKVEAQPLSRFEGHCLCQRTRECESLLQLAVLGVIEAIERHSPDQDLAAIAHHLGEAEQHVEAARRLAARWNK